jgi:two-component system cell cycle sensor histidine kinase/response regulator CckA
VEAHERAEIAAAQLRQSLKMEAVGQLTGGIAHDFNNLLMVIDGYAKRARNSAGGQTELIAAMDQVLSASNRGADLIRQLLTFSRRQTVEKSAFSVEERLGEIRDLLSRSIGELYELRFEIGAADLCIETDPGEFDQAIMNLVINARDASRAGGIITIRAEAVELGSEAAAAYPDISPGPFVRLSVIDEGQGISDENLQHVFEPFFTTKEQGQGTGLGLATVYGMVRQSGGMAEIESALGVGTKVRLYLPSVDRPGLRAAAEVESEAQGHGETILLVEDDTALLALMKDTVSALGYNVLTADGGFTALEVESDYEGEIDLLLSDVIMPSITGPEVAKMLQELRPNIRVVLMSGYPARARQQVEIPPDTPLLQKPFKTPELAATLRQELEYLKKNAA